MEYAESEFTVRTSILALDRSDRHKDVIKVSGILEVLHLCPDVKKYWAPHYAYFFREMKIKAHVQVLW